MALSPAERQQRRRDKLKTQRKIAPDAADSILGGSFAAFLQKERDRAADLSFIDETLDSVGMHLPANLETEADPEWEEWGEGWGTPNRGALGRAERMVDALIDSAKTLAELIQRFKLQEIDAALERLSRRKLATPADRKKAFQEHKRLSAIRDRLTKEVRHSFPQHVVKGEIET
jgi:hypothetical protein